MSSKSSNQGNTSFTGAIALWLMGPYLLGEGSGATGVSVGELCFNTAITGYQEILTDPSYAGQLVLVHVPAYRQCRRESRKTMKKAQTRPQTRQKGAIFRAPITPPANWRGVDHFDAWLKKKNIIGLSGVDTRAAHQAHPRARHAESGHRPCA